MNHMEALVGQDSIPVHLKHWVEAIVRQELDRRIGPCQPTSVVAVERLSERETEVLTLIANGYARNEISRLLGVRYNTVCTHIANIYSKLSISTIAEATQIAIRSGLA